MFRLRLGSESGIAMIVTLIVTFIGSVLAASYMGFVIQESRHSVWQKHRAQSLFLAEAGIEKGLYYLNNFSTRPGDWALDESGNLVTPCYASGSLTEGNYQISLYDQFDEPWLPPNAYLIKSTGTIPRMNSKDIDHRINCVAVRLDGLPIPGALSILDDADVEIELDKFDSNSWSIDGRDMDDGLVTGLPGIAVANNGDQLDLQLGGRLSEVTGGDEFGNYYEGKDAILENPKLPKHLDAYANYFRRIMLNVSSPNGNQYTIPEEYLGTYAEPQVLFADLSKGDLKLAGNTTGYGVLVLEGNGEFEMAGNSTWNGVIICAGNSNIRMKGGGATPAHIYGALLVANGVVEMNGTADVQYSSDSVSNVNFKLLLYQVYSWCGGWGVPLGS